MFWLKKIKEKINEENANLRKIEANQKLLKGLTEEEQEEAELLLECDNEILLYKAFNQLENENLQEIILTKLNMSSLLEKIALNSNVSNDLRIFAMKKVNMQSIFEKIASSTTEYEEIRMCALENITKKDDNFWYDIIIDENNRSKKITRFCVRKIKNQNLLAKIVKLPTIRYSSDYCFNSLREWLNITRKIIVLEAIEDENILKDLYSISYLGSDEIYVKILKKINDEEFLMQIYRNAYKSTIKDVIISKFEELNYENSLTEIIIKSHDKEFISRCIFKFTSKELLVMIIEQAEYWYAILLAEKRLKELTLN